jgi:hypothetical protein
MLEKNNLKFPPPFMLPAYFRRMILTGFLFAFHTATQGQTLIPQNLQKYDKQKIHFGFLLGFNSATFIVKPVPNFNLLDSLYILESASAPGFHLGILANLRLGEHFDLRFLPDLSFSQRDLKYTFVRHDSIKVSVTKTIESTYLEFPLQIKFKSNRIKNYRIYLIGGFKYSLDMASQSKVKDSETKHLVKLDKNNYCYEFGIGLDAYMELFKLSPEIKISQSLNNLLVPDVSIFSSSIDRIFSQLLYVTVTFE